MPLPGLPRLLCWLALAGPALALDPALAPTQYVHDVWRVEDGLPQGTVLAILQTRDGYLWLGTDEGLDRFDGVRFVTYSPRNTPGLNSYVARRLHEGRDGTLWVGTHAGLSRLRDGVFTTFTSDDGLATGSVVAICEDRAGTLWVGTEGGLSRWRDGRFTSYTVKDGLPHSTVLALLEDRAGALWVGTPAGLVRWRDGALATYTARDGLTPGAVSALHEDRAGTLWVGTGKGLAGFRDGRFTPYTAEEGLPYPTVNALCGDRDGNLWVATWGGGLARLHGGRFAGLRAAQGLSDDRVHSVLEDREGNLWVGTRAGLDRLRGGKFVAYTGTEGLSNDSAWSVGPARDGGVWVGTFDGWNLLRDNQIAAHATKDVLNYSGINAILEDRAGALWLGTYPELYRVEGGRVRAYGPADGMPFRPLIRAMLEDRHGTLWVGAGTGLCRRRGDRFEVHTTQDGLPSQNVTALHEDRAGTLWVGTAMGLCRLRPGEPPRFVPEPGTPRLPVQAIHEDSAGALWLGTGDGGLYRLRNGRWTAFTTRQGLHDDGVYAIVEDDGGHLWLSSNTGISRVPLAGFEAVAAGRLAALSPVVYDTADGLKSRECSYHHRSAWKASDGRLWFATERGVVVVDPRRLVRNEQPPPVHIEEVLVDERPQPPRHGRADLEVPAGAERLELRYTGLSLTAPEKVRFRYRLESYDRDWVSAGTRRSATYTRLPPGEYRFRVIAANNDDVWNETGAALAVRVLPRFWQTRWFLLLCALAAGLAAWGAHRLRLRRVEARHALVLAERTRLARELHDNLLQGYVGIGSQLSAVGKLLDRAPELARRHLEVAHRMTRHSVTEARRAIHDLRDQSLESGRFAEALTRMARQAAAGSATQVSVTAPETGHSLPGDAAQQVLRVAQEAVANALTHAQAGQVRVALDYPDGALRLTVEDDGHGFDAQTAFSSLGGHFGLLGMRERAERLGGQLTVDSAPGRGTRVELRVPANDRRRARAGADA